MTAIPITHYRILSKQQPATTPRLLAKHASRVGPADACFRDCIGAAWQPLTVAPMLRPRRAMCVRRRSLPVIRTKVGKHWIARPRLMLCLWKSAAAPRHRLRAAPTLARPRRCSGLAPDDETTARRPLRKRGRRRRGWLVRHASESQARLQVVADRAASKHTGDSHNRGNPGPRTGRSERRDGRRRGRSRNWRFAGPVTFSPSRPGFIVRRASWPGVA